MHVDLTDGRRVTVPLSWYPLLERASEDARASWVLLGGGTWIRWEPLNEDILLEDLLARF